MAKDQQRNFLFGLEHEVAFLKGGDQFADFTNTSLDEFEKIIEALPQHEADLAVLRAGSPTQKKRWYVEGYERFSGDGTVITLMLKGIEVRTVPHASIAEAAEELLQSFNQLQDAAHGAGLSPAWVSYNPFHAQLVLDPPLNQFERKRLEDHPDASSEQLTLYTFGPDLNLSADFLDDSDLIDIAKKLTYYSPYIVPFSFSSPFYKGKLWDGYSIRTYIRTGDRHAAKVFVSDPALLIKGNPLVTLARIPSEHGRIEFKAFDTLCDFGMYASLLALLKGIVLDPSLAGRAAAPDKAMHQRSAKKGFHDEEIWQGAVAVVAAAKKALHDDPDGEYLDRLEEMLAKKRCPAELLIKAYNKTGSIIDVLHNSYEKFTI